MANGLRRSSTCEILTTVSHCHRCQLDLEPDPKCNGRTRILCPFCGEFLTRPNLSTLEQLKEEINVNL